WDSHTHDSSVPQDVYAARVGPDGSVLDPGGIAIATSNAEQSEPAVASNGSGFFVVWRDNSLGDYDIFGARVTAGGTDLDPVGLQLPSSPNGEGFPVLAPVGSSFRIVWMDDRHNPWPSRHWDIFGELVAAGGSVSGEELVSAAFSRQSDPAIGWNGSEYLVA